jgi:hypothetical protein
MRMVALVFGALAALVIAGVALAGSGGMGDQGRRLSGPFCINKRSGLIISIAAAQPCKPGWVRKYGEKVYGKRGPKGDAGRRGSKGATGDTGATGATGAPGPTLVATGEQGVPGKDGKDGKDGTSGKDGTNGTDGANGSDAVGMITGVSTGEVNCLFGGYYVTFDVFDAITVCNGAPGAAGAAGPQGETGPQGDAGATGPQGETGATGPQGPKGDTGATGPQGPKGDTGVTGPQGPQGPQGANGLDGSTIVEAIETGVPGQKTTSVLCPFTPNPNDDPTIRMFAISGGFAAQGSVTESYRSAGGHGWTVTQSSGNSGSLKVYAYCVG